MYAYPININSVARRKSDKLGAKPAFARTLIQRRDELGLSMIDVERETNGVIYDQLMWRLENGRKPPNSLKVSQRSELARILQWSRDHLDAVLGVVKDPLTNVSDVNISQEVVSPVGTVEVQSARDKGKGVSVPTSVLAGKNPAGYSGLEIGDDVLLCERAFVRYNRFSRLILAKEGDETRAPYLVYRLTDGAHKGFFVVLTQGNAELQMLHTLAGERVEVSRHTDERLEYVGMVAYDYSDYGVN